jgi:undecaprenyl diphosphate synthase
MVVLFLGLIIPLHLAIILDGNRRAGEQLFGDGLKGHERGGEVVEFIIRLCIKYGIKFLTLYAFSTENWKRSEGEKRKLFDLFRKFFSEKREESNREGIRYRFIGRRNRLPLDIRLMMTALEDGTRQNDRLIVTVALDYGGRDELVRAALRLCFKIVTLRVNPFKVTEIDFEECLDTCGLPPVDLLLRTGGEKRVSNFLLWQIAYAEFVFIDTLLPLVTEKIFINVLKIFSSRDRRFGGDSCKKKT